MGSYEDRTGVSRWVGPGLVVLVGAAAYSTSLEVPFQFDDFGNIVESSRVSGLSSYIASSPSPSRYLAFLSFALNGSLGGGGPFGFHLVNVLIHLAAALCVGALASGLARRALNGGQDAPRWAEAGGLLAALLFVAHPLQTQAVTYVVQRMTSLAAFFALAAALAHLRSLDGAVASRRLAWRALATAATLAACFTKENAVVAPALILLVDVVASESPLRARLARVAPYFAAGAVAAVALVPGLAGPAGLGASGPVVGSVAREYRDWSVPGVSDRWVYLATQPRVLLTYLRLLLLPVGQNFDHEVEAVSSPASLSFVAPVAVLLVLLAGAAAAAARWGRSSRAAWMGVFAVAWFLLALSVESSVIPLSDLMNEHRVYLPSAGVFAALGVGFAAGATRWDGRTRQWAKVAAGIAVVLLATATWLRNEVWREPCALWADTVSKSPGKGRPRAWLARCLDEAGDTDGALAIVEEAAQLPRPGPHVMIQLGALQLKKGQAAQALESFRRADDLGGGAYPGIRMGRGLALLDLGRTEDACAAFEEELRLAPGSKLARANVGTCRYVRGDLDGAIAEWRFLASRPNPAPEVCFNLAMALAARGDRAGAREAYELFLLNSTGTLPQARAAAERWLADNPR